MVRQKGLGVLSGILCLFVLAAWGNASYIYLKAELAQWLIADSWQNRQSAPWPWADTRPLARLSYGGEEYYVLSGGHGTALAFGPGHIDGTALPGKPGTSVVVGHRDTHFGSLKRLAPGSRLQVEDLDGSISHYIVTDIEVVDTRLSEVYVYDMSRNMLVLMTCYPFEAVDPGGPLRYVVSARPAPRQL